MLGLIVLYLLLVVAMSVVGLGILFGSPDPPFTQSFQTGLACAALGAIGGCVYCLRAVYLNACVYKRWDSSWWPWYVVRPLVSTLCGGISFIFISAGLLVLEASTSTESTDLGFYALAFIAGLNVDKFVTKLEDIAQAVWGIEKSRAGQGPIPRESNSQSS